MKTITEKTAKVLDILIPEGDLDSKVKHIIIENLKRKSAEYHLIKRRFEKKYGMILEEFERKNVIKERGYSYEVETDYHEWDSAVDAIETIELHIKELSENDDW
jgi:phage/plasmid-associated DNA primase